VATGDVFELIARLGQGTRQKDDIDKEIEEERESWGDVLNTKEPSGE
jgi:hypothetical protein